MTLVNNNTGVAPAYPTSAALPQMLPTTQQQWQDFLNQMQQRFPQLPLIPLIDSSVTPNLITLTSNCPLTSSYAFGTNLLFQAQTTNTSTTVHLNLNGLGNQLVVLADGSGPPVGSIVTGSIYTAIYDGTNFELQISAGSGGGGITSVTGTLQQIVATTVAGAVTVAFDIAEVMENPFGTNDVVLTTRSHDDGQPVLLVAAIGPGTIPSYADILVQRGEFSGTAPNVLGRGAGVGFESGLYLGRNTGTAIQASGGQTEIWQIDQTSNSYVQVLVIDANHVLHVQAGTSAGELIASDTALTDGSGGSVGTLTNAPAAGNPTKWIKINDNGTIRSVPSW